MYIHLFLHKKYTDYQRYKNQKILFQQNTFFSTKK
jgi:hypothetical protein